MPSIGVTAAFGKECGLMQYSAEIDLVDQFRQAASYVDRILKSLRGDEGPARCPCKPFGHRHGLLATQIGPLG
jgi:hypothetical protein